MCTKLNYFLVILVMISYLAYGENQQVVKQIPISNSGFEFGDKGWTRNQVEGEYRFDIDSEVSHSGQKSAKIETVQGGWARWLQQIPLEEGKVYRISVYVKGTKALPVALWVYGSGNNEKTHPNITTKWQKVVLEFVKQKTGDATLFLQTAPRCSKWQGGTVWFDDVMLEDISAERSAIQINGSWVLSQQRYEKLDPALSDSLQIENASKGYIFYQRKDLRYFYPNSIPQPSEVILQGIKSTAAQKQTYASTWFMVYAMDNLKDMQVSIKGDLISKNGLSISKDNVQIKMIRFWKQRSDLVSAKYYDIPELLIANTPVDLTKNGNQGVWIQTRLSGSVKGGTYKGTLLCQIADKASERIPFTIEVLPFDLETPADIHWINYQNDERWNAMSNEQVRQDIEATRDYGIDGMILEVYKGGISLKLDAKGKVQSESRRISLYQKYRKELGMTGPLVIAPEKYLECYAGELVGLKVNGGDPNMSGLMNNLTLQKAYVDSIRAIDDLVKAAGSEGYDDWYYCGTDEPFTRFIEKSKWENRLARQAGAKTASTCYPEKELKLILPYLDADITPTASTVEENNNRLKLLKNMDCEYWFLGAGTYDDQEGGLMPNRYQAGFLFYKSGATASVHWTFQRVFGNPYDDFDGAGVSEPKETCLTYPPIQPTSKTTFVSTLQWEGIREGVDDYKYAYTLVQWIERAKREGLNQAAGKSQKVLNEIVSNIPWRDTFDSGNCIAKPGTFNNQSAEQTRSAFAAEILKLKDIVSNH
ncbi:MAG: carbohydrate binding domain-containing protein [Lentisphaeria bacterium]